MHSSARGTVPSYTLSADAQRRAKPTMKGRKVCHVIRRASFAHRGKEAARGGRQPNSWARAEHPRHARLLYDSRKLAPEHLPTTALVGPALYPRQPRVASHQQRANQLRPPFSTRLDCLDDGAQSVKTSTSELVFDARGRRACNRRPRVVSRDAPVRNGEQVTGREPAKFASPRRGVRGPNWSCRSTCTECRDRSTTTALEGGVRVLGGGLVVLSLRAIGASLLREVFRDQRRAFRSAEWGGGEIAYARLGLVRVA